MKKVIIAFIFLFSLSAGAYYGLGYSSIQSDLDDIKRKQECLEKKNREQREYSECLERCREEEESNRQIASITGGPYISSSCFCSSPISIGCY